MRRLSPFLLSLIGQCALLVLAMCFLDDGHLAIVWACGCALWDLLLIGDWTVAKFKRLRRQPLIALSPVWVSLLGPALLSFPASWAVAYLTANYSR
jgi:hypothetical protein